MSALATFILENMEEVLHEWQEFASTVVAAKGMNRITLRDDAEWILLTIAHAGREVSAGVAAAVVRRPDGDRAEFGGLGLTGGARGEQILHRGRARSQDHHRCHARALLLVSARRCERSTGCCTHRTTSHTRPEHQPVRAMPEVNGHNGNSR